MSQDTRQSEKTGSVPEAGSFDIAYLLRCCMRRAFVIIMCACIAGVGCYILSDRRIKASYVASANLAMVGRSGSGTRYSSEYYTNNAVTVGVNVLNSDLLRAQVEKRFIDLNGTLYAYQVSGTNLIRLTATADTARDAFLLLKAAINEYPSLSSGFDSGFLMLKLGELSTDSIRRQVDSPMRYARMAVLAVIAAGFGLIALFSYLSTRLHNSRQARALLDMDILGTVHFTRKKHGQKALLITDRRTDTYYAEEIDRLSTHVQLALDKNHYKSIVVTSIYENEGKSTIAVNLALNLAKRGKKVVLVEGDMRRPAVAKILGIKLEAGFELSDYLMKRVSLGEVLLQDEALLNLQYLLQQSPIANPDRLLGENNFANMIKLAAGNAAYVILDTPPAGVVRDTEVAAPIVDAVFFVLRQDMPRAEDVNDAIDAMEEAGTAVLGGVFNMASNMVDPTSASSRYGQYYYGYGSRHRSK